MTEIIIARRLNGVCADGKLISLKQTDLFGRTEPIIVLGEAGMGKTTLLEEIGERSDYRFIHARRLVRARDPLCLLGGATTFVIDALDELSAQDEGEAVDKVLEALEKSGWPNFILSCRVADWRSATSTEAIAECYAESPLELFLQPIGRDEANNLLVHDVGKEKAETIISHFEDHGLDGLFGNPQTLKLIRAVSNERELPTSRADLFELSAKKLWAEHSKKKAGNHLSRLTEEQALNAAGAAFAALILTGKRAVSRMPVLEVDEDDLPIAEIDDLLTGTDVNAVLQSRLLSSSIEGNPDRFSYTHRSVGEFLAARWLALSADTDRKRRRLLKLFHGHGLVPANLRGVHAWLALDPRLATQVITADPMGVIEYGDTNDISVEQARALINALYELSERDPRYYDFQETHSLRGIAKPTLSREIKELIIDQSTPLPLKAMLLHSISGSPVADELAATLEKLLINPDVTFYERRIAGNALVHLQPVEVEWAKILATLHDQADQSSLRLALELLPGIGFSGPSDRQIVELIVAFCGLSICEYPRNEQGRIGGVLWGLEKRLPEERIEPILNILADYLQALLRDDYDRYGDSDVFNVIYTLTERRLALGNVESLTLWRWLSCLQGRRGFRDKSQKVISEWIRENDKARRTILRSVLIEQDEPETVWMRGWRLRDLLDGLYPDEDDIVYLLSTLNPRTEASGDRWQDLVRLCSHDQERGLKVREAAIPFATEDEGREFLRKLTDPDIPKWEVEQAKRQRKEKEEKEEQWAEHRASFMKKIDDLREGEYAAIINPAQAYLNLYSDMGDDVPAHKRIEEWLGPEIQNAAFQGFEAYLSESGSKPTAVEIADSYAQNKHWPAAYIFVAAAAERVRKEIPLDNLSDDRLLAILLEIRFTHISDLSGIDDVAEIIEAEICNRPGLWEKFWRLRIEPQLASQKEHPDGLHQLAGDTERSSLAVDLAIDWLDRFPQMSHQAEVELIDCLITYGKFQELKHFARTRRKAEGMVDERRAEWDAVAFLVDFQNVHGQLQSSRADDPNFLWRLRSRFGRRHDERAPAPLSPVQLSWIIRNFRRTWKYVSHPVGSTMGNTNAWDATEYLTSLINRLGGQTTSDAVRELSSLHDEAKDGYTAHIKRTRAEQAQKVVEESFTPPSITELKAILVDGPPRSMAQLQAVMCEELAVIQKKIRSHPVDWHKDFYENANPKDEEACRDTILKMLGDYPSGILCEPEGHLADDKRADIKCTIGNLMLPIEIKGQWHKDLWGAADTQLDRLYSADWRAERRGIYLVLWFGARVPKNKKLKGPKRGLDTPSSASELQDALIQNSECAKQGNIEVIVVDLVRP
ncbi:NACHT domain-containing protein [Sulfitobacter delicatus]|uniref:Uncharacterized protein n=1 Tax=Sulfitobacter delicatus TaxID=218672 RepID=A0A1G7TTP7_9RHOB|nr:hypothetical protein [Sulfitobacter delicatus]SDG37920.1 hypothetical protein SAMN04489759_10738 [Sulfitobacter delicatus]